MVWVIYLPISPSLLVSALVDPMLHLYPFVMNGRTLLGDLLTIGAIWLPSGMILQVISMRLWYSMSDLLFHTKHDLFLPCFNSFYPVLVCLNLYFLGFSEDMSYTYSRISFTHLFLSERGVPFNHLQSIASSSFSTTKVINHVGVYTYTIVIHAQLSYYCWQYRCIWMYIYICK